MGMGLPGGNPPSGPSRPLDPGTGPDARSIQVGRGGSPFGRGRAPGEGGAGGGRGGAEVRLYDTEGRILATRQVHTGGGYNTQVAAPVHFGLRSLDPVRAEVSFMGRSGRKVQEVGPINPSDYRGRSLVVREGN